MDVGKDRTSQFKACTAEKRPLWSISGRSILGEREFIRTHSGDKRKAVDGRIELLSPTYKPFIRGKKGEL